MDVQTPIELARIRALNDIFRRTFVGGVLVMTRGVAALPESLKYQLFYEVKVFNDFSEDNDPHQEHDFGSVKLCGTKYYWQISYYDRSMEMCSPDPSDASVTKRVLTIMRQEEY